VSKLLMVTLRYLESGEGACLTCGTDLTEAEMLTHDCTQPHEVDCKCFNCRHERNQDAS
jgi:hypothetical protein